MPEGAATDAPAGQGVYCPVCGLACAQLAPGPSGRPLASCPWCGCLERHRLLTVVVRGMGGAVAGGRILEIAPSPFTTGLLRDLRPSRLVSVDFDPAADGRSVDVQASLTDLPFADAVFDFLLCLHVLEHIPDDRAAMSEIARVLSPAGLGLLQVPWSASLPTDEEVEPATAAERIRRFGRADHVRQYGGTTLDDRLRAAGLEVFRFTVTHMLGPDVIHSLGLMAGEVVWLVRPGAAEGVQRPSLHEVVSGWLTTVTGPDHNDMPDLLPPLIVASERAVAGEKALAAAAERARLAAQKQAADLVELRAIEADLRQARSDLDAAAVEAARLQAAERAQRRRAQLWKDRYTALRGRLPIRVAVRVGTPLRALTRAAGAAAGIRSRRERN